MSIQAKVPDDHPLMIAWNKHKASEEYADSKKWVAFPEHIDGSLWELFAAGFAAAQPSKE